MMWRVFWISMFSVAVGGLAIALLLTPDLPNHPPSRRVRTDFQWINSALITYKINSGHLPSTEQGLRTLVEKPTSERVPDHWIQIIDKVPTDPWMREYQYRCLPDDDPRGYELRSLGPDGKLHTKDDLSSLDGTESDLSPKTQK